MEEEISKTEVINEINTIIFFNNKITCESVKVDRASADYLVNKLVFVVRITNRKCTVEGVFKVGPGAGR